MCSDVADKHFLVDITWYSDSLIEIFIHAAHAVFWRVTGYWTVDTSEVNIMGL
jgi:hypothetical protein